jgi:C1A family cysteine protease
MSESPRIRRILAPLLVLLGALPVGGCGEQAPWLAPVNPEFVAYLRDMGGRPEEPVVRAVSEDGRALGYIPSPIPPERRGLRPLQAAGSPSDPSYDMRDPNGDGDPADSLLPAVRNQGTCGSCWAFATYGSLESHIQQSLAEAQDFSEDNLKHLHGFDAGPCDGGNLDFGAAYMARYDGPISEADDPYSQAPDSAYCTGCSPVRYADNVAFLPTRASTSDNAYIKQAVLDYGGLYTTVYWTDGSYNSTEKTYYYGSSGSNHAVVIVGWDDDKYVPNAPAGQRYGAFIVRNSWGASWGEGGYFYVSYYDRSIAFSSLGRFDERAESAFSFDRVHSYDELGYTSALGFGSTVAWGANWFAPAQDEDLTAVGFYATDSPTAYEIYVYDDFSGGAFSDLRAAKSGAVPHPGRYTVVLDDPVPVLQGDGFGVVIKFTTDDYGYPIPLEAPFTGYSSAATANPGESYVSGNGSSWTDATSVGGCSECNVCIKAFASDPEIPPIPLPASEAYGRISGGDQTHVEEVDYGFEGAPGDVVIAYEVWDADFATEVEILVNGAHAGYAAVTPDNTWSETRYVVLPDAAVLDGAANVLAFDNTYNPPKTYWWGVRNVSVFEGCFDCLPLPEAGAYGRISGGDQTHVNEVNYRFEGTPGDVTIRYQAWDMDFANEVEVLVNDASVGHAAVTPNNTWSEALYVVLPDALVFDDSENVLTFDNTYNPPKTYWWGVRNVSVFEECPDCIPLPAAGAYGRISGGDQAHVNEVHYSFVGAPGDVAIFYQAWDVDFATEVEILVNGEPTGYAPVTPNETWSGTLSVVLPDAAVFDGITNVLTFDNTYNPPKTYWWGVRNVTY